METEQIVLGEKQKEMLNADLETIKEELVQEKVEDKKEEIFVPQNTADFQLWQVVRFMMMLGFELDHTFFSQGRYRFVNHRPKQAISIVSFDHAVKLFNSESWEWDGYMNGERYSNRILPWFNCSAYAFDCAQASKIIEEAKLSYWEKQRKLVCYNFSIKFVYKVYYKLWKHNRL